MEKQILILNEMLRAEEIRLQQQYFTVKDQVDILFNRREISDYEIDVEVMFFSDSMDLNKRYRTEEGDAFYTMCHLSTGLLESEDFNTSWAEGADRIYDLCYTTHHLLYDSPLSDTDILAIDDVWFDLIVRFQFAFAKTKGQNFTRKFLQ